MLLVWILVSYLVTTVSGSPIVLKPKSERSSTQNYYPSNSFTEIPSSGGSQQFVVKQDFNGPFSTNRINNIPNGQTSQQGSSSGYLKFQTENTIPTGSAQNYYSNSVSETRPFAGPQPQVFNGNVPSSFNRVNNIQNGLQTGSIPNNQRFQINTTPSGVTQNYYSNSVSETIPFAGLRPQPFVVTQDFKQPFTVNQINNNTPNRPLTGPTPNNQRFQNEYPYSGTQDYTGNIVSETRPFAGPQVFNGNAPFSVNRINNIPNGPSTGITSNYPNFQSEYLTTPSGVTQDYYSNSVSETIPFAGPQIFNGNAPPFANRINNGPNGPPIQITTPYNQRFQISTSTPGGITQDYYSNSASETLSVARPQPFVVTEDFDGPPIGNRIHNNVNIGPNTGFLRGQIPPGQPPIVNASPFSQFREQENFNEPRRDFPDPYFPRPSGGRRRYEFSFK